jgi:hypothetical protein
LAVRKRLLIDSVTGPLAQRLNKLRENKATAKRLIDVYSSREVFGDLAKTSYTSLIDTIREDIANLNIFIQSAKTNMSESRYLPGILTDIVAGGKRSDTKRSNNKRRNTKRKTNRKNRKTLRANARR